jgi:hypothetical protein
VMHRLRRGLRAVLVVFPHFSNCRWSGSRLQCFCLFMLCINAIVEAEMSGTLPILIMRTNSETLPNIARRKDLVTRKYDTTDIKESKAEECFPMQRTSSLPVQPRVFGGITLQWHDSVDTSKLKSTNTI